VPFFDKAKQMSSAVVINSVRRLRSSNLPKTTTRGMGWLKKNKFIDEFGGLRESTYRDYTMTPTEWFYHTLFLFLPACFIYTGIQWTFERRMKLMGIPRNWHEREFVEVEEEE
jgi:hypothetical protein